MNASSPADLAALDALTGGAFTAATASERSARIRDWLATEPAPEQLQAVFKELSHRDKGAAKPLREKIDELRRAKAQDALAGEWAAKANALLTTTRLNIADAMAWQRDAARAGAPLSREPLATLKVQLAERIKAVEDLQNQAMVQREASVLLAQRIELLSTKPWQDADAADAGLAADVAHWRSQADALAAEPLWGSVDAKHPTQLDAARQQLSVVWDAFQAALTTTRTAAQDAAAPLPPVPVWADQIAQGRGAPAAKPQQDPAEREAQKAARAAQRDAAVKAITEVVVKVEQEVAEGHAKSSAGAATNLRNALRAHGKHIPADLEARVNAALVSAGELEGWQRWRADQIREELVAKAEALVKPKTVKVVKPRKPKAEAPVEGEGAVEAAAATEAAEAVVADAPQPAPADEATNAIKNVAVDANETAEAPATAEAAAPEAASVDAAPDASDATTQAVAAVTEYVPVMGGRKLQDTLRQLREQWKQTDQGGAPNHALWKRFDAACNRAHKFVDEWLETVRAEAAEHRAQRLALIEEVKAWGAAQANATDWKGAARTIHQFSERWRNAGHLSEKAFAELQPQWKAAIHAAAQPLEDAQKASTERRHALIEEAKAIGAAPMLRIDAVRAIQQRWQAEAQAVPLDRKQEQKLWDAFRKPIDDAFNRKTAEREKAAAATSALDKAVLDAAKALEAANASGDAQKIRAAMAALEAAVRGQTEHAQKQAADQAAEASTATKTVAPDAATDANAQANAPTEVTAEVAAMQDAAAEAPAAPADDTSANAEANAPTEVTEEVAAMQDAEAAQADAPKPVAPPKPRPVVAVRGDDRPGMKKETPAVDKFGKPLRPDARGGKPGGPGKPGERRFGDRPDRAAGDRGGRFGDRPDRGDRFGGRDGDRGDFAPRGPRLGDQAFRAQRDAMDAAQQALKKLAAQAHGEALMQVMNAWQQRSADGLPTVQELGRAVTPALRNQWGSAIAAAPQAAAPDALLRLEMAAEVPTPAEHLDARRALQLQLLTRRNDPSPAQTWGADAARVLASPHDDATARRLQNALKALLRK